MQVWKLHEHQVVNLTGHTPWAAVPACQMAATWVGSASVHIE